MTTTICPAWCTHHNDLPDGAIHVGVLFESPGLVVEVGRTDEFGAEGIEGITATVVQGGSSTTASLTRDQIAGLVRGLSAYLSTEPHTAI